MSKSKKHPPHSVRILLNDLASDDGTVRERARNELVEMGRPAIDFLAELIESSNTILRWEAVKAMSQIADPVAAPLLVIALFDSDYEVRWIATEGLINIGEQSIKPLLEALTDKPQSLSLREGAHHVLHDLKEKNSKSFINEINLALKALEGPAPEDEIQIVANEILNNLK
jgi:HEAT repeat protein